MAAEDVFDAPPLSLPPQGLLYSAIVVPHDTDDVANARWINGIKLAPELNTAPLRFNPCSVLGIADTTRNRSGVATFMPFGVEAYDMCSTLGFERADYEGRARRALAARETIGVEMELDDGVSTGRTVADGTTASNTTVTSATAAFTSADIGSVITGAGIPTGSTITAVGSATSVTISNAATLTGSAVVIQVGSTNPHFQDPSDTVLLTSGTALALRVALMTAEQACATFNLGVGMIHARPYVVSGWSALNMLQVVNKKLFTVGGHQVVEGAGYSGKSPAGVAPSTTSEFVYVTEPLQVQQGNVETWIGPDQPYGRVARTENTIEVRAQRINSIISNKLGVYAIQVNPSTL